MRGAGVQVDAARVGYLAAVLDWRCHRRGDRRAARRRGAEEHADRQPEGTRRAGRPDRDPAAWPCGWNGSSPAGLECTGTYGYRGPRTSRAFPDRPILPVGSTVHGVIAIRRPGAVLDPSDGRLRAGVVVRVILPAALLVVALAAWSGSWSASSTPAHPRLIGAGRRGGPLGAALPLRMAADPDKPTLSERFTRAVIKADSRPEAEPRGPPDRRGARRGRRPGR